MSLHGQPFREVATEELAMLDPDAHCWTEGLSDWVPVHALGSAPAGLGGDLHLAALGQILAVC